MGMQVSLLGERSARTVRDKCGRLTQTAMLLGMESVEELLEFWGDRAGHVTWRLSPAEVRTITRISQDPGLAQSYFSSPTGTWKLG